VNNDYIIEEENEEPAEEEIEEMVTASIASVSTMGEV